MTEHREVLEFGGSASGNDAFDTFDCCAEYRILDECKLHEDRPAPNDKRQVLVEPFRLELTT